MKIAGSFLKIADYKEKIQRLNNACDLVHFDIMDGIFTKNKTLPLNILKENTKDITKEIDIHLMVNDNMKYIKNVIDLKPKNITFHIESAEDPISIINYIKSYNIKVGIAINPSTEISLIKKYLDKIDLVLVMSVKAGAGGQKFIDITDRLNYLYEYRKKHNLKFEIEVDGGINMESINKVKKADIVVVGTFITSSSNYEEKVKQLKKNGFTLIELLGAIVILSIISIIAITTIDAKIKEGRIKTCLTQEKNIKEAAKIYITDYPNETSITVSELITNGYLDDDFKNPMTEKPYKLNTKVIITGNTYTVSYDTNDVGCS